MNRKDLLLIDAWRHEKISEEDFKGLEARMETDPELRAAFRALTHLEDGLHVISQRGSAAEPIVFRSRKKSSRSFLPYGLAASLVALFAFWALDDHPADLKQVDGLARNHYLEFDLPLLSVGKSEQGLLSTTTLILEKGETELESLSGAKVRFEGPGTFGLNSAGGGVLYHGSMIARMETPEATYAVEIGNLRILDRGTAFAIRSQSSEVVEVEVLDGEIEVQSLNRVPKYFWNFDENVHSLGLGSQTKRVEGLIGKGALAFNNHAESYARIFGQTGKTVGSGEMTFSTGLSIETLFVSKWSGKLYDYDEFFRKEDGNYRIILSFQNDKDVGDYDCPEVEHGPVLSFGLFLDGFGYQELDMPLDGNKERPNISELTDGQAHYLVAKYDSFSGRKSIHIDGKEVFSHTYPVGTLILSGGPTEALLGNHRKLEPFNGILDEFAIYPFALQEEEITEHYRLFRKGLPYFDASETFVGHTHWIPGQTYAMGWKLSFNRLSGKLLDSNFIPR